MSHWIAGILTRRRNGRSGRRCVLLTVYDSARSPAVEETLRDIFAQVWPSLRIMYGRCPHQKRFSDDCGIYMTANFFARHFEVPVPRTKSLPSAMRTLLDETTRKSTPSNDFMSKMRQILRCPQGVVSPTTTTIASNSEQSTKSAAARVAATTTSTTTMSANNAAHHASLHGGTTHVTSNNNTTTHSSRTEENETSSSSPPQAKPTQKVFGWTEKTLEIARRTEKKAYEFVIDHLLVATVMAMCGDGVPRGLAEAALKQQRGRYGMEPLQPYSATEMLRVLGKHVHTLECAGTTPNSNANVANYRVRDLGSDGTRNNDVTHIISQNPTGTSPVDELYLIRGQDSVTLPDRLLGFVFKVGAVLREAATDMNGKPFPKYYSLVTKARDAEIGVYIPETLREYDPTKPARAARGSRRYKPSTADRVDIHQQNTPAQPRHIHGRHGGIMPRSGGPNASSPPSSPANEQLLQLRRRKGWNSLTTTTQGTTSNTAQNGNTTTNTTSSPSHQSRQQQGAHSHQQQPEEDVTLNFDGEPDSDAFISEEARAAFNAVVANPLNMWGRPQDPTLVEAPEVCPRNWFLYSAKPPHIEPVVWNALRPDTRAHHLRWLNRIKCMPYRLLHTSLPCACIDLIMNTARARNWKWATTAKAFAGLAGALRDLPIYSTQKRGISIKEHPEWRAAFMTVQRYMKESVPDAAPHLRQVEVEMAVKNLMSAHPRAALFLNMMWAFAARACDISTLKCKDISFQGSLLQPTGTQQVSEEEEHHRHHTQHRRPATTTTMGEDFMEVEEDGNPLLMDNHLWIAEGMPRTRLPAIGAVNRPTEASPLYKVSLTIRRGKGARCSGPYHIPSVLTREMAAMLQEIMQGKTSAAEEVFAPYSDQLRTAISAEISKIHKGAQLPSVRKGSLRCMAEKGVPTKDLMAISGHKKVATLLRYLGYGQQPTVEAETARANAGRALFPAQTHS